MREGRGAESRPAGGQLGEASRASASPSGPSGMGVEPAEVVSSQGVFTADAVKLVSSPKLPRC